MKISLALGLRYLLLGVFVDVKGAWHIFPLPFVSICVTPAEAPPPDETRVVICARGGCSLTPKQHHAKKVDGAIVWEPHEFVPFVVEGL